MRKLRPLVEYLRQFFHALFDLLFVKGRVALGPIQRGAFA
jgi:hypothetical protein